MTSDFSDFIRMHSAIEAEAERKNAPPKPEEPAAPMTVRILYELAEGPATAAEISASLEANRQHISGSLCNMRDSGFVRPKGNPRTRSGPIYLYHITAAGHRRLKQWETKKT